MTLKISMVMRIVDPKRRSDPHSSMDTGAIFNTDWVTGTYRERMWMPWAATTPKIKIQLFRNGT